MLSVIMDQEKLDGAKTIKITDFIFVRQSVFSTLRGKKNSITIESIHVILNVTKEV